MRSDFSLNNNVKTVNQIPLFHIESNPSRFGSLLPTHTASALSNQSGQIPLHSVLISILNFLKTTRHADIRKIAPRSIAVEVLGW